MLKTLALIFNGSFTIVTGAVTGVAVTGVGAADGDEDEAEVLVVVVVVVVVVVALVVAVSVLFFAGCSSLGCSKRWKYSG